MKTYIKKERNIKLTVKVTDVFTNEKLLALVQQGLVLDLATERFVDSEDGEEYFEVFFNYLEDKIARELLVELTLEWMPMITCQVPVIELPIDVEVDLPYATNRRFVNDTHQLIYIYDNTDEINGTINMIKPTTETVLSWIKYGIENMYFNPTTISGKLNDYIEDEVI